MYLYFWLIIIVNPLGIDPVHCRSRLSCMHEPRYQCKLMSWVLTHYVTVTTKLSIVVVQSDLTQSDCQLVNVICSSLFQEKTNKEEVDSSHKASCARAFWCILPSRTVSVDFRIRCTSLFVSHTALGERIILIISPWVCHYINACCRVNYVLQTGDLIQ